MSVYAFREFLPRHIHVLKHFPLGTELTDRNEYIQVISLVRRNEQFRLRMTDKCRGLIEFQGELRRLGLVAVGKVRDGILIVLR